MQAGTGTISFGTVGGTHPLLNFTANNSTGTNGITVANNITTTGTITLSAGGNVTITAGNLDANSGAASVSLSSATGAVQETGAGIINGGLLTTSSVTGTALGNNNTVSQL